MVLLPAGLAQGSLPTSVSQACLSACSGKLAMLEFLVRKANGLLQTHLEGGELQERVTGFSP